MIDRVSVRETKSKVEYVARVETETETDKWTTCFALALINCLRGENWFPPFTWFVSVDISI